MRPWHAADLPDANFHEQAGDVAASLCGVPMLRVFPLEWDEDRAAHGCPACRSRARRPS